jgi:hypothetical protein
MALAAETRAAWVASFDRMTPTRALIALLVWLRASERISVNVLLGMYKSGFVALEWNDLARRGIGMSCGKVLWLNCRTKGDGRKIRRRSPATRRRRDEADHICACASPSHRAMAIGPSNTFEIG